MQGVIADGSRGVHGFLDIAVFEKADPKFCLVGVVGVVSPNPGIEISLKLKADGKLVICHLRDSSLLVVHFIGTTSELLDVVTDFVRDNIGVGKVATTSEFSVHLLKESGIDENSFSFWEIEWPHS